jgi:hypothetical protein
LSRLEMGQVAPVGLSCVVFRGFRVGKLWDSHFALILFRSFTPGENIN